jgi:hypothetical protein
LCSITTVYFSIFPKYCNNALYSENKRYVLLKKLGEFWIETVNIKVVDNN